VSHANSASASGKYSRCEFTRLFRQCYQEAGDPLSLVKGDNPLTGPFFIEGAEPGDTLVVHILDLQVDGNQGLGAFAPGFGALNETNYTPMLHPPLPEESGSIPSITLVTPPRFKRSIPTTK